MLTGRGVLTALFFSLLTVSAAVFKDRREAVPQGFVSLREADSSQPLDIMLALASSNIRARGGGHRSPHTIERELGKHWNQDQVNAFLILKFERLVAVNDWLWSKDISGISAALARDWIFLKIPVRSAKYERSNQTASRTQYPRTRAYSPPRILFSRHGSNTQNSSLEGGIPFHVATCEAQNPLCYLLYIVHWVLTDKRDSQKNIPNQLRRTDLEQNPIGRGSADSVLVRAPQHVDAPRIHFFSPTTAPLGTISVIWNFPTHRDTALPTCTDGLSYDKSFSRDVSHKSGDFSRYVNILPEL
ncbi:hypothetical protein DFH07DRAFT_834292 [Mycena maculata]|uniref:Peptidase S53 activation domain-containing protein n=1 Tax=Mycena maculata TaxID=230809 RepID=A0AAD7ILZ6_9AGAR|nr:hypothetical protein DFH07DRAFT_834292 [Mycena maculata]